MVIETGKHLVLRLDEKWGYDYNTVRGEVVGIWDTEDGYNKIAVRRFSDGFVHVILEDSILEVTLLESGKDPMTINTYTLKYGWSSDYPASIEEVQRKEGFLKAVKVYFFHYKYVDSCEINIYSDIDFSILDVATEIADKQTCLPSDWVKDGKYKVVMIAGEGTPPQYNHIFGGVNFSVLSDRHLKLPEVKRSKKLSAGHNLRLQIVDKDGAVVDKVGTIETIQRDSQGGTLTLRNHAKTETFSYGDIFNLHGCDFMANMHVVDEWEWDFQTEG